MPTPPAAGCPSADTLLAFDRGDLPEPDKVATANHLGRCAACRDWLATASPMAKADPLLRGIGGLAPDTAIDHAPEGTPPVPPRSIQAETGLWGEAPTITAAPGASTGVFEPEESAPDPCAFDGVADAGLPPETFGPYRLLGKLGEGGMGIVYRAHDPRLKRTVALKMIRADRASPEERSRFLSEAEAVARLEHPNIVHIFELGEVDGQPFTALEYVAGGSLDQRIKETLPDPRTAARLMIPIALGMHAAHEVKIVHRDLKPANILLTGDAKRPLDACIPKVTDFGLVKFLDADDGGESRAHAVMGTPSYMAPEQAEGRVDDIGPAADLYALGAILYELLTGRPPFKGTTVRETLKLVVEQEPVPPRALQAKTPRDLETICLKCLQKSPDRRYASATALADDLQRFLNGEPIAARPVGRTEKLWRWGKRKPALAGLIGFSVLAMVALLVGAFWFTYAVADERREKEVAEERAGTDRAEREAADVRRQSAEDLQKTNRYYALATQARERIVTREPGWTWRATGDIREAAGIDTPARNPADLRSDLAACLAGTDIRESRVVAPGFHARVLCFHPNGRWLILAEGRSGFALRGLDVAFVDCQTGETIRKLSFPAVLVGSLADPRPDMAYAMAISPDGRWLAVGARSGTIHRWDLQAKNPEPQTWTPERVPFGKSAGCSDLAFAPDTSALYVATVFDDDGTITRWDTTNWKQTARFETKKSAGGLAVHPHGAAIYCTGPEFVSLELDPVTLEKKAQFARDHTGSQAISPDGRILGITRGGNLSLWDTRKREPAYTIREANRERAFDEGVNLLRISPDGRLLVAASEFTQHVYLIDLATGERLAKWRAEPGTAYVAFDPSSRFLAIAGQNRTTLLDIGGQREHRIVAVQPYTVRSEGLSPDGQLLATTASSSPQEIDMAFPGLWNLGEASSPEPFWSGEGFGAAGSNGSVSFAPDGSQIAMVCEGEIKVFDRLNRNEVRFSFRLDTLLHCAFGTDGQLWMIADKRVVAGRPPLNDKNLLRWTNQTAKFTGLGSMTSLAVAKSWVVVGGLDGSLRLFPTAMSATATELAPTKFVNVEPRIALTAIALAPDGSLAVVGSDSGKGYLVALPGGTVVAKWEAHRDAIAGAVFLSPCLFATGGKDRAVRFWSWDGQQVRAVWTIRTAAAVTSLGKSANGHRLSVTCEGERGVHVWDLAALGRRFAELGLGIDAPQS